MRSSGPSRARHAILSDLVETFGETCNLTCFSGDDVLYIETSAAEGGGKHIDRYVYEIGACMMCGLCVEACPFSAIEMSHEYELATRHGGDLVRVLLQDVDAASPRREKKGEADA